MLRILLSMLAIPLALDAASVSSGIDLQRRPMDPQPPLVLQCDGTPPKLVNQDKQSYDYEIQCGAKTEKSTISAGAEQELKKKAGCLLKLGKNGPAKLHTEMVCTIKDGALKCDLL